MHVSLVSPLRVRCPPRSGSGCCPAPGACSTSRSRWRWPAWGPSSWSPWGPGPRTRRGWCSAPRPPTGPTAAGGSTWAGTPRSAAATWGWSLWACCAPWGRTLRTKGFRKQIPWTPTWWSSLCMRWRGRAGCWQKRPMRGFWWRTGSAGVLSERGTFVESLFTPPGGSSLCVSSFCQLRFSSWTKVCWTRVTCVLQEQARFPAVLDLYTFGGGLSEKRTSLLASRGFVVLTVALYGHEDLPRNIKEVHLDYFEEAIEVLRKQEKVSSAADGAALQALQLKAVSFPCFTLCMLFHRWPVEESV